MSDMVSVPAEKIAALREAIRKHPGPHMGDVTYIVEAAWDLVVPAHDWIDDPATTSDEKLARFRSLNPEPTRGPSPARDDAEVIAGLLAEHDEARPRRYGAGCQCRCGAPICTEDGGQSHDWHFRAHVASVIAAHMAAPDELTALRERIKALADDADPDGTDMWAHVHVDSLRALLGDA